MATKAENDMLADRGCAKEAAELLAAINTRRWGQSKHADVLHRLVEARETVGALVEALGKVQP